MGSIDVSRRKWALGTHQKSMGTGACINCGKSISVHELVANHGYCTKCLLKIEQRKEAEQIEKQQKHTTK